MKRTLAFLIGSLLGCVHTGHVTQLYEVRCYSGGTLIFDQTGWQEPWAGGSGTWRLKNSDGTVVMYIRADCMTLPASQ